MKSSNMKVSKGVLAIHFDRGNRVTIFPQTNIVSYYSHGNLAHLNNSQENLEHINDIFVDIFKPALFLLLLLFKAQNYKKY